MPKFELLVKITSYRKVEIESNDIDSAKDVIAQQLRQQKQNFEFMEVQDAELVDIKPQLLLEEQLDLFDE